MVSLFQKVYAILTRIKPIPSIQKLFVAINDFSDSVLWQQSSKFFYGSSIIEFIHDEVIVEHVTLFLMNEQKSSD